jgi:hypothetical protein
VGLVESAVEVAGSSEDRDGIGVTKMVLVLRRVERVVVTPSTRDVVVACSVAPDILWSVKVRVEVRPSEPLLCSRVVSGSPSRLLGSVDPAEATVVYNGVCGGEVVAAETGKGRPEVVAPGKLNFGEAEDSNWDAVDEGPSWSSTLVDCT